VVAAFTHFPTSYQRAKVVKFPNEGNAAITQNCPLYDVAAFPLHCPTMVFFLSKPFARIGAWVSPKIDNGAAVFYLCGFAIWCLCVGQCARQHDIANLEKRPSLLFCYSLIFTLLQVLKNCVI